MIQIYPNDHAKRVDACNTKDGRYKCLVFENPQREKLGTLGRVPEIYTNIYHIYGLYTGCIGQYGVMSREQLLGYPPNGTQMFPLNPVPQFCSSSPFWQAYLCLMHEMENKFIFWNPRTIHAIHFSCGPHKWNLEHDVGMRDSPFKAKLKDHVCCALQTELLSRTFAHRI